MKLRIKRDPLIRDAFNKLRAAHPDGLPNMESLKRQVSLEAIISSAGNLDAEPETIRGESRWCCPFHHDTNPSLWAHDDYKGTGVGRWGCNPCGISGDVYDFLERLHGFSKREAIREVRIWYDRHRSIRIRLRSRSGR